MSRRGELNEKELNIIKKKVNDEEAFEKFFRDCYLRNLRPATVEYYKNEFQAFRRRIDKELVECNHKDIEDFILMSKQSIKITTINTRLRALRSFYNFLFKNKLIDKNPMKNIKLLRDRQKNIETLDNKEIELLSVKKWSNCLDKRCRKRVYKVTKGTCSTTIPTASPTWTVFTTKKQWNKLLKMQNFRL
ncbi:tyrosine-type recombinase/integrase [Priestia flexa]|uniref:tyrosine-type recombinase/integrase n=1 Tax=Priestia flexa TaxID=86664 RepID=UPI003D05008C